MSQFLRLVQMLWQQVSQRQVWRSLRGARSWRLIPFLVGVAIAIALPACSSLLVDRAVSESQTNPNLLMGMPTEATSFNANDYLINRPQYVLSYNQSKAIPNWASWQLNRDWLGDRPRLPFEPDSSLPPDWPKAMPNDYTNSGFDRGHVVPAADRNRTEADSKAVFLMTNILPQTPDNNRGPWESLESYCRDLVSRGKELYIIAGPAGEGGSGERGKKVAIAQKISVPAYTWKVIVVLDQPGSGLDGITDQTRVIAVIMPNKQGIKDRNWREFRTSVDEVEEITGYNLLSNLPENLQNFLEAEADNR
ncbi:MAG: DNA/RNA non-specific endonuclease [Oculatellaceae cyanobacterium Prado106]|jgi:endonuclease G|nr:DNA/RNA non-specific endonuclease [Oculatellaceae cyanobacterium Prado106]